MALPITALYAAPLALLILWLAVGVMLIRRAERISLGDGGNKLLERRMRGHANAVETIPIALILLGLSEGMGAPAWVLHLFGLTLLIGRVLHGIHFREVRDNMTFRVSGILMTIISIVAMALSLFVHALVRAF